MSLPSTRYSLLSRLRDPDDVVAWQDFISIYHQALTRFCRRCGLDQSDADEVVQEVWVAVSKAVQSWQPSGHANSLRAWLFETTRRLSLEAIRRGDRPDRRRALALDKVEEALLPNAMSVNSLGSESSAEGQWIAFHLAAASVQQKVARHTWLAFWETAVRGRAASDVADELETTSGAVYTAKCRVHVRIRNVISEFTQADASDVQDKRTEEKQ